MADRAPIPRRVRKLIMRRCRYRCEDCEQYRPLELHHLRYLTAERPREPIFGRESPDDLAALCRDCHHKRHLDPYGRFWVDPEDLAAWHEQRITLHRK
jgi:hypothetical protein